MAVGWGRPARYAGATTSRSVNLCAMGATSEKRGRLVRVYEQTRRLLNILVELIHSVFAGVWLGILRSKDLDAIDHRYHVTSPFVRTEHSRLELFFWERRCVERFPSRGRILVIGAGGGREMLALARMGYELDGCECNPLLVAVANKVLAPLGCSVCVAERDKFVAPRPPYDVIVVGWGAYALIRGRANRIRFLESVRSVVKPDAPLVLSFPTRSEHARGLRLTRTLANILRRLSFREPIEFGDNLRRSPIHHFSRAELESEIQQAGYEIEFYGDLQYGHAVCRASRKASA